MSNAEEWDLDIPTPRWAVPLLRPARYKGIKGGRGGGKSHERAEALVEAMVYDRDLACVCIREIQRSIKFSAYRLIVSKIYALGVESLFEIQETQIKRRGGRGICLFQGMQDHTADSVRSLEDFGIAWIEEARALSERSLKLLRPTIRAPGSEIWATWNPEDPEDPIDRFFAELEENDPEGRDHVLVHVNLPENPHKTATLTEEMERDRVMNPDDFGHVWLGEYSQRKDSQVFAGKWRVDEFEPGRDWEGPYFGADWGFSQDPTVLIKFWIYDRRLWVEYEAYGYRVDIDKTGELFKTIPGVRGEIIRADNARPETINYLNRNEPELRVIAADKWPNSIEDGVAWLRGFDEIIIHERCEHMQREARLYSHKIDRRSGNVLKSIEDRENHGWDSIRYGACPMIKRSGIADYDRLTQW